MNVLFNACELSLVMKERFQNLARCAHIGFTYVRDEMLSQNCNKKVTGPSLHK